MLERRSRVIDKRYRGPRKQLNGTRRVSLISTRQTALHSDGCLNRLGGAAAKQAATPDRAM
jgi:hypothetical protein